MPRAPARSEPTQEAQHRGNEEPERHDPEEEPVGEAAGEQPGRRQPLALERLDDEESRQGRCSPAQAATPLTRDRARSSRVRAGSVRLEGRAVAGERRLLDGVARLRLLAARDMPAP